MLQTTSGNRPQHERNHFDCKIELSNSPVTAAALREFSDAQMPRTGVGEMPWSTPLSPETLAAMAEAGKAQLVTARLDIVAEGLFEKPIIGVGALLSDSAFEHPRLIIVVDKSFRGEHIGSRLARELLARVEAGETVQAEVQNEPSGPNGRPAHGFFKQLGFACANESDRRAEVPEYVGGSVVGKALRSFALFSYTK
jgi:hypothetical protein